MFEKVNPCHPDKVADRVAGALVDLAYSKAASKRGQSDACIDFAEREQARPTGQRPKPRGKNNEHRFHGLYGKADSNVGLSFLNTNYTNLTNYKEL